MNPSRWLTASAIRFRFSSRLHSSMTSVSSLCLFWQCWQVIETEMSNPSGRLSGELLGRRCGGCLHGELSGDELLGSRFGGLLGGRLSGALLGERLGGWLCGRCFGSWLLGGCFGGRLLGSGLRLLKAALGTGCLRSCKGAFGAQPCGAGRHSGQSCGASVAPWSPWDATWAPALWGLGAAWSL